MIDKHWCSAGIGRKRNVLLAGLVLLGGACMQDRVQYKEAALPLAENPFYQFCFAHAYTEKMKEDHEIYCKCMVDNMTQLTQVEFNFLMLDFTDTDDEEIHAYLEKFGQEVANNAIDILSYAVTICEEDREKRWRADDYYSELFKDEQ